MLLCINPGWCVCLCCQGRHGIMMLESTAVMSSPREDPHTVLMQGLPFTQVTQNSQSGWTAQWTLLQIFVSLFLKKSMKKLYPQNKSSPHCCIILSNPVFCAAPLGVGGSRLYPEAHYSGANLHHCCQFGFRTDDPRCSHLVSVEGELSSGIFNSKSQLQDCCVIKSAPWSYALKIINFLFCLNSLNSNLYQKISTVI